MLNTPSIASCGHEPSFFFKKKKPNRKELNEYGNLFNFTKREKKTDGVLARHDETDGTLDGLRVWVLGVHERHRCPARLDDLSLRMLDPPTQLAALLGTRQDMREPPTNGRSVQYSPIRMTPKTNDVETHLVALTPPPIRTLLRDEQIARFAGVRARGVRLAHEREALERELGRVGEADAPAAHPCAVGMLASVEIVHGTCNCRPAANMESDAENREREVVVLYLVWSMLWVVSSEDG